VAIRLWGAARNCYGFGDCTAYPTQKEEIGGTASLSSSLQLAQIHRRNSAHTEQSAETAFLTSPSQLPLILFRGATKSWPRLTGNGEFLKNFQRARMTIIGTSCNVHS
jgi:hypothetical protein